MNPIIFETKYFALHTFWILFAVGFITSVIVLIKLAIKNGLKIAFLSENSLQLILWAILGGRIISLIENYKVYFYGFNTDAFFRLFHIWDKGLNIWGALAAALIAFYFICRKKNQDFFKWLDIFVPAIIVGLAFGHLGAFFEGVNYGKPTSLPWGVNFESPNIKYTVPIHPTQIYAFIYSGAVATSLFLLQNVKKIKEAKISGIIGLLGISIYGFFSFLEESIRGDDTLMLLGIRVPLILTVLISISTGIILYLRYNEIKLFKKT